jgi:hypothetical protein
MKVFFRYLLPIISFFFVISCSKIFAENGQKQPIFAKEMDLKSAKTLLDKFEKQHRKPLMDESQELVKAYDADINNDQKIEHVFVFIDTSGSAHYIEVRAIQPVGSIFKDLGEPPKPKDSSDGPFYFEEFKGNDGKSQLLAHLADKTYMVFMMRSRLRDAYIWKDGITQHACDEDWAKYERTSFQSLYHAQQFDNAYAQLSFYLDKCKGKMKPELYLWMKNDQALVAIKIGNFDEANKILCELEGNSHFRQSSEKLKQAVAFNKLLCTKQAKLPVVSKFLKKDDFTWLQEDGALENKDFKIRLKKLLSLVCPSGQNNAYHFRTEMFEMLQFNAEFIDSDKRYIQMTGCVPHDCAKRGYLWIDTQEGTSLLAFFDSNRKLDIISKNFNEKTLPLKAKQALKSWSLHLWTKEWSLKNYSPDIRFTFLGQPTVTITKPPYAGSTDPHEFTTLLYELILADKESNQDKFAKFYFAPELYQRYAKVVALERKSKEPGCLEFDNFTGAQEIAYSFWVGKPTKQGTKISVPVYFNFSNILELNKPDKPDIILSLVRDKNRFWIDDILYCNRSNESLQHLIKECLRPQNKL